MTENISIISREDARAAGLRHYYTGVPCNHGHSVRRFVSSGGCMECLRLKNEKWRLENPEKRKAHAKKQNSKRDPKKVAAWLRAARAKDPERYREYDKRNYYKNKAAGSDYQKRKYAATDKEKAREDLARWKAENPEKVRKHWEKTYAKNKHKHHQRVLRWNAANPEKVAAQRDKRRAWENSAKGEYTGNDIKRLFNKQKGLCFYCNVELGRPYHIDHFIPLSRGGSNWPSNLRLACVSCNCSKSNKMPWDWMPERFERT